MYFYNLAAGRYATASNSLTPKSFFFPNPVQSILNLQLTQEDNRLEVMEISGKKIFDKKVPANYELDMSAFVSGLYFIRVENSDGILNGKVIKK